MYIPHKPQKWFQAKPRRTYTAWAGGPPPCEGVWRVKRNKDQGSYAYWDGKCWGISQSSPALAYRNRVCESLFADWEWFGLTFQPLESLYAME